MTAPLQPGNDYMTKITEVGHGGEWVRQQLSLVGPLIPIY
jgi:hypothetical protein